MEMHLYETSAKHAQYYDKTGFPQYFDIDQFTFQTPEQFFKVYKEWQACIEKDGEYIERFFKKPDGTVDFQQMIIAADDLISHGCESLLKALDPTRKKPRGKK